MVDSNELREFVPQSCKQCRAKKARCDRSRPCLNCERTGQTCVYETITRTPLTRKYLTQVEDELARTKNLLFQYESATQQTSAANVSTPSTRKRRAPTSSPAQDASRCGRDRNGSLTSSVTDLTAQYSDVPGRRSLYPDGNIQQTSMESPNTSVQLRVPSATSSPLNNLQSIPKNFAGSAAASSTPADIYHPGSSTFTIESPPVGDFDWDERPHGSTGRFADGMATLTDNSSRGYMGVASGAALLRLTEDGTNNDLIHEERKPEENNNHSIATPLITFTLSQLEPYVDAYFTTYHNCYPIVHEASFRAQFMELIPRPDGNAWKVLLYIVATTGAFAAAESISEVDIALFEAAKSYMSIDMLETGNITIVQALTLMSNYVQKRNRPNSGYNYLGLAKRIALGIGLHKEFAAWRSKPLMLETRRRVWYCLYIFDVGAIITFSRPLDLPRHGIEVQLPLNVSDGDITGSTCAWPAELKHTTLYTHVRCQARFHAATLDIYERLISSFPEASEMLELDDAHLGLWLQELPSYFRQEVAQEQKHRLSHAILQWRWRNMRILMYRPYLIRDIMARLQDSAYQTSGADSLAIQRCQNAVEESIALITSYWQTETQNVLACWYSLYFLLQALLIPVLCLRNDTSSQISNKYRQQIRDALSSISSMSHINPAAPRCHRTIIKLCGAFLGDDTLPNVTESPQTQLTALNGFIWPNVDMDFTAYEGFHESAAYDFMTNFDAF